MKIAALAIVAALIAGCSSSVASSHRPSATPGTHGPSPAVSAAGASAAALPSPARAPSSACSTSAARGSCGPYDGYSPISGTTSSTYIGNDVWNPIGGWLQTLHAADPGNWHVTANMPAGNTSVVSYPSVGANYGERSGAPTPLSHYASIYSSFTEDMNATSATSAWAAYDIWLGHGASTTFSYEVMIQHDFANNGPCTAQATARFGGSGGVPVQLWDLCQFDSELVWKLTGGNESTGSVDILAMLTWLVNHGYLPKDAGLFLIGYGWEICSTGGHGETFQVSRFSLMPTMS